MFTCAIFDKVDSHRANYSIGKLIHLVVLFGQAADLRRCQDECDQRIIFCWAQPVEYLHELPLQYTTHVFYF